MYLWRCIHWLLYYMYYALKLYIIWQTLVSKLPTAGQGLYLCTHFCMYISWVCDEIDERRMQICRLQPPSGALLRLYCIYRIMYHRESSLPFCDGKSCKNPQLMWRESKAARDRKGDGSSVVIWRTWGPVVGNYNLDFSISLWMTVAVWSICEKGALLISPFNLHAWIRRHWSCGNRWSGGVRAH